MCVFLRHCGVKFSSEKEREEVAGLEPENQLAAFTGIYSSKKTYYGETKMPLLVVL
jgi:hypothetical protein